jgi:hypothetical protein
MAAASNTVSFNKPRAVIDNSQVSEVLLAAAYRRCQIETPMLRHRIRCACLGMARRVLSAYKFGRFEVKTSKRFSSTSTS